MGIVTNYLRQLIKKQVDEHGLVVWYDAEKQYAEAVEQFQLEDVEIFKYESTKQKPDSFFRLRYAIEDRFNGAEPPRLLIYVLADQAATHHALIEIEVAGVVLYPGHRLLTCNTRLSVLARAALKEVITGDALENIVKSTEAGKYTLHDLDDYGAQGVGVGRETLTLIFAGKPDEETALLFLTSDRYDQALKDKDAVPQLQSLLVENYGLPSESTSDPAALRTSFVRYLLRTDLLLNIVGESPAQLAAAAVPVESRQRDACLSLANTWRQRMDLHSSYIEWAATVEEQLRIASMPFRAGGIEQVATFLAVERILQREIAAALVQEPSENAVRIAEQKQATSFWSQVEDVQPLWALIASAGRLLLKARRVEHTLKNDSFDAGGFISAYTSGDEPLCNLDAIHRQMELGYHKFTFYPGDEMHDLLGRLVSKAREQYMRVGSALAAGFVTAYQQGNFALPDVLRQTQIFDRKVKPHLDARKVAYIWVDALRFEMARDLIKGLRDDFEIVLEPAVAVAPTITVFGMAALLPNAERLRAVVTKDVLIPQIDDARLKDRSDRLKYFRSIYPNLVDAKLSDLVPKPKKSLETSIRNAELVLITSQEIDESGETDAESARLQMDNILRQLQQALRILVRCGIQTIVLTADHGHLFGETLGDDMRIDAPGGETAGLHRRAWIGHGGTRHDAFLRTQLSKLGMNSDFEIVVPYGFGVFPVQGGASRYFHGGLSPQELIIPVLTLTSTLKTSAKTNSDIQWELKLGAQKLGRFFSVQVTGASAGLFPPELPAVRAELRVRDKLVSTAVSAGYGYDSSIESVQLRWSEAAPTTVDPNTITLMVNENPERDDVGELLLLDAIGGIVLAKLKDLEFAIHM